MSTMTLHVYDYISLDDRRDRVNVVINRTYRDTPLRCLLDTDARWPDCECPVHRPDLHPELTN